MKKQMMLVVSMVLVAVSAMASVESKTWPATDKAKQFVKDTVVIGFFASPWGTGWTEDKHLHEYLGRARASGITGHSMTIAAGSYNFNQFLAEHHKYRDTMTQDSDNYTFVHSIRDIESAHIKGKTAVIWNSQTSSIIDGDLKKIALLKEMGLSSIILSYNDLFRAGAGCLAEFNGNHTGVTAWGLSVVDEMVKNRIIVDMSHMGHKTTEGIADHMEKNHPGVPFVYTHSLPMGLYKTAPKATTRGCYRNITDGQALRCAKSGGYVSPTFTEWMMDGVWPDDITPKQCAEMIDYYVKLVGADHVGAYDFFAIVYAAFY